MWTRIVEQLKSKRTTIGFVALTGLLMTTIATVNVSGTGGSLSQLSEGMQICFARVGQSFTARMLGNMKSPYLQANFMATTEECLGDVIHTVSSDFEGVLGKSSKKLNMLASNIHWFHEKVNMTEDSGLGKVTSVDIEDRFAGLEGDVEEFAEKIDEAKMNYLQSEGYLQLLLGILALLVPFLFVWEFFEKRRLDLANATIENQAASELMNRELKADSVRNIIGTALKQNRLLNCTKIFDEYSYDLIDAKPSAFMPVVYDEQKVATKEQSQTDCTHLSGVFSDVVSTLSGKLFGQEIFFDTDLAEEIFVDASAEAAEQAIFYLISDTIKRFSPHDIIKRILVKSKKLGGTTILTVEDTTKGFGEDFITGEQNLSIDLKICQEVAKDFSGTLVMENLRNKSHDIKGSKVQLVFKTAVSSRVTSQAQKPSLMAEAL